MLIPLVMRASVKRILSVVILLSSCLAVVQLHAEGRWKEALVYSPPFKMLTNANPERASATGQSLELYTMGSDSNGVASVAFQVDTAGNFEPEGPPVNSVADLRSHLEVLLKKDSRGTNYSIRVIKIDGYDALNCRTLTVVLHGCFLFGEAS